MICSGVGNCGMCDWLILFYLMISRLQFVIEAMCNQVVIGCQESVGRWTIRIKILDAPSHKTFWSANETVIASCSNQIDTRIAKLVKLWCRLRQQKCQIAQFETFYFLLFRFRLHQIYNTMLLFLWKESKKFHIKRIMKCKLIFVSRILWLILFVALTKHLFLFPLSGVFFFHSQWFLSWYSFPIGQEDHSVLPYPITLVDHYLFPGPRDLVDFV